MIITIPTRTDALFWSQATILDGVSYLLTFQYNSREAVYYLQIQSSDGKITYAQGIKLVSNYMMLGLGGYNTPPGDLMALSCSSPDDSPAKLGELGINQRVVLLYMEQADIIAGESWRNPDGVEGL
jgi:hypothetical protein